MTDHLQQKAAEIVREQLGYQVPASLESMRVDHPYEYKCALAGVTAGIAMAAPEELRELSEKATPGPWHGPCLNYNPDGKRTLFPHIHIGAKNVIHVNKENEIWTRVETEGHCKDYLTINTTSTGGDLQHFDDNAAFIVACVNYVRMALAKGETQTSSGAEAQLRGEERESSHSIRLQGFPSPGKSNQPGKYACAFCHLADGAHSKDCPYANKTAKGETQHG